MKQMKRFLACILVAAMVIAFMPRTALANASSDAVYGFHVSGTRLLDANGTEFIMRGVNHAHTWYKDQSSTALKAIANTGCNTVRLVLSNGGQYSKDDLSSVKDLISQCKQYKMIAVVEVHDATGKDDTASLEAAADYFIEMKSALIGNEAYVIVNIANEWYGSWETSPWKSGYISVIKKLRNAGIKNTIMVDAAGWGQYPASIAEGGKEVLAADTLGNTMFATHMYEYAGGDAAMVKNNIDSIAKQGLCQVIGEFGWKHTSGDVAEETIMSYCQQLGIGYMAWSWKGNGGGVEYLDLSHDWAGNSLSDWGDEVVNGTNGLKNTAKVCSVFSGGTPVTTSTPIGTTTEPAPSASVQPSQSAEPAAGTVNILNGSIAASSWSNIAELSTAKNGGTFDASIITSDGYFTVTYTGDKNAIQLVFQSWSGGAGWAEAAPSQITQANGSYIAKFSYDDITSAYGTKFSLLDKLIIRAANGSVTLNSFDYVTGGTTPEVSAQPSQSTAPSAVPSTGKETNYFSGSKSVGSWSTAAELSTIKNGGTFDPSLISASGSFQATYTGTKECLQMIFQSWSGGANWAVITPDQILQNADGSYTACFSYNKITSGYGTSFSLLDRIYLQTQSGSIVLNSFDYLT